LNEIHREPIKDAGQKRREYLSQIGAANMLEFIGGSIGLLFGFLFVFISMVFLFAKALETDWGDTSKDGELSSGSVYTERRTRDSGLTDNTGGVDIGTITACATFFSFTGVPALCGLMLWDKAKKIARAIPYVPPVSEQIAALPAEAILVRGSDDPVTPFEELLRSTPPMAAEQDEDLLRVVTHP
jgi:hypothetical protein